MPPNSLHQQNAKTYLHVHSWSAQSAKTIAQGDAIRTAPSSAIMSRLVQGRTCHAIPFISKKTIAQSVAIT
jgi:hypothetical protein